MMTSLEENVTSPQSKLSMPSYNGIKSSPLSNIELNLPTLPQEFLELTISSHVNQDQTFEVHNKVIFPLAIGPIVHAEITNAVLLTKGSDVKKIVDMTLDVANRDVNFQPGDTIGIVPCNRASEVNKILKHLNLLEKANLQYTLCVKEGTSKKNAVIPSHIPTCATIQHVLQDCVEIRSVPKKLFLRVLAEHTSNEVEKRRLEELCSRQGAKEYTQCIVESRTTFLDILDIFPSCCPPVERLFEFLPRLIARPYSIASSPLVGPTFHIIFSLLEFPQHDKSQKKHGVCTGWLYSLAKLLDTSITECEISQKLKKISLLDVVHYKPKIPLFFRKNNGFRLPEDPSIPLILVGPGTGVAPFLGFLQHRECQKERSPDMNLGDIWLFYGCRDPEKDFVYKSEIEAFAKKGVLSRLYVAFSRNPQGDGSVKYVQDSIRLHSKDFSCQLLEKNCMLYICGDATNMANDVFEAVVSTVKSAKNISDEEAYATVNDMKSSGRYVQDIWT